MQGPGVNMKMDSNPYKSRKKVYIGKHRLGRFTSLNAHILRMRISSACAKATGIRACNKTIRPIVNFIIISLLQYAMDFRYREPMPNI